MWTLWTLNWIRITQEQANSKFRFQSLLYTLQLDAISTYDSWVTIADDACLLKIISSPGIDQGKPLPLPRLLSILTTIRIMIVRTSTGGIQTSRTRSDRFTMLQLPFFQNNFDNLIIFVSSENIIQLLLRWLAKFALSPLVRKKDFERFIRKKR